jgi:hypothetical protein
MNTGWEERVRRLGDFGAKNSRLFQMRRPRFRGADGVGRWRLIITGLSWLGILVNAMVIVITGTAVRDRAVIPLIADAQCVETDDAALHSDMARFLGTNTSFTSDCARNFLNCYANIGDEPWLPAATYLTADDTTTKSYLYDGLCFAASPLYNARHCNLCKVRRQLVWLRMVWCIFVLEHALLAMYVVIAFTIPDQPHWVVIEKAKNEFQNAAGNNPSADDKLEL